MAKKKSLKHGIFWKGARPILARRQPVSERQSPPPRNRKNAERAARKIMVFWAASGMVPASDIDAESMQADLVDLYLDGYTAGFIDGHHVGMGGTLK